MPMNTYQEIHQRILNSNVFTNIRFRRVSSNGQIPIDVDYLVRWLIKPMQVTVFRVNTLRQSIDLEKIRNIFEKQNEIVQADKLPLYYNLTPDCLVVEQWKNKSVIPRAGTKQIVVDAVCGAAILRGAHVFAPGVLGIPGDITIDEEVDIYADIDGKCKKGLKINYDGAKIFVGWGIVKMRRNELFGANLKPSGIAIRMILPVSQLPVIDESIFEAGDVLLQNLPSLVCSWVLDPQPGDRILDMCAAPGNKTTHLAELSKNQATIIALDKIPSKIHKIKERCRIHNVTCVQAYAYDSTKSVASTSTDDADVPPFAEQTFDRILLDAPCSALGQRPLLLNRIKLKELQSYKFLQRKLFAAAIRLLKPNGRLVYSTCTVNQEENEGMVQWVLDKFECIRLVAAEPLLGGPGWADTGLSNEQRVMVQRFGPEKDTLRDVQSLYRDTVGFFIACFTKISTDE